MATQQYSGMFGPSPEELRQIQRQQADAAAMNYGRMTPQERIDSTMYRAGGMLTGAALEGLGYENTAQAKAKKIQSVVGQIDTETSAGLLDAARKFNEMGLSNEAQIAFQKANELKKQEAAVMLAQQKQDEQEAFRRDQLTQQEAFRRDQLVQAAELKKMQLEQTMQTAKMRSEDTRYSADQRREAAAEATAMRGQIAVLAAEMKKMGVETKAATSGASKPLSPAQQTKLDKSKAESSAAIRAQDSEIVSLGGDIDKVMNDPNLSSATGVSAKFWSLPGGGASRVEGALDSIANRLKAQGLKVLREGGGIGAITEKEWDILANQVANIDRTKGMPYVKGELEKIKLRMNEMKRNASQRHAEQFGEEYSGARDIPPPASLPSQDAIAAELARRKGGR